MPALLRRLQRRHDIYRRRRDIHEAIRLGLYRWPDMLREEVPAPLYRQVQSK